MRKGFVERLPITCVEDQVGTTSSESTRQNWATGMCITFAVDDINTFAVICKSNKAIIVSYASLPLLCTQTHTHMPAVLLTNYEHVSLSEEEEDREIVLGGTPFKFLGNGSLFTRGPVKQQFIVQVCMHTCTKWITCTCTCKFSRIMQRSLPVIPQSNFYEFCFDEIQSRITWVTSHDNYGVVRITLWHATILIWSCLEHITWSLEHRVFSILPCIKGWILMKRGLLSWPTHGRKVFKSTRLTWQKGSLPTFWPNALVFTRASGWNVSKPPFAKLSCYCWEPSYDGYLACKCLYN